MIMMMSQNKKHFFLRELLCEDQEPFQLNNYISEKQSQINKKRPTINNNNNYSQTKTTLQLKKQKSIQQHKASSTFFPINLCKNACFNATTPQDITKSPLFKISQQHNNYNNSKSPCSSPNTIFLHVPARTASILLEAALRIQKHSKTKTHYHKNNNSTFGLLGSLFKRLTQRTRKNNKKKKKQIEGQKGNINNNNVKKVKDILRFELDSCSAGRRRTEEEEEEENNAQCYGACFVDDDDGNGYFCESPFRFVLQRSLSSSSSGRRTPEFSSPAASPNPRRTEDKESNNGEDSINKFQSRGDEEEEEEEEKEQCSPVSVLDPPFEDDDDVHENDYEEGGFDLECSYANVQRTKQQLLYRLHRFEKLADLDPLELEKRMLDQEDNECGTSIEEEGCEHDNNSETCYEENNKDLRELVYAILCQSSIYDRKVVSEDLKRLVSDLIIEEEIRELNSSEYKDIVTRVCRSLELWKEVDSNTIDMMIDEDFSREEGGWKKNAKNVRELAGEFELAIFSSLVEEFSEELGC